VWYKNKEQTNKETREKMKKEAAFRTLALLKSGKLGGTYIRSKSYV